jgi:hypothetical protein
MGESESENERYGGYLLRFSNEGGSIVIVVTERVEKVRMVIFIRYS